MNKSLKNNLAKIHNRQLARLLVHLEKHQQLSVCLEKDLKRAYRYVFEDIEILLDKELGTEGEQRATHQQRAS